MITENYVSYEVAKLLKEKWFDGKVSAYYHIWDNGSYICTALEFMHSEAPHLYIPAPTHQMAMKWLRDVHKIHIETTAYPHSDGCFYWGYKIMKIRKDIVFGYYQEDTNAGFNSHEEAVEEALKHILENLL